MNWKRLRERALEKLYPSEKEIDELEDTYNEISAFIESEYGYETFFAGSAGRRTCVKGDRDIDVFVLFPKDVSREQLEKEGLGIGEETFKEFNGDFQVEYAEHPYTKGEIQGFEVEIVPCVDTSPEDIQSAVDRSPHHAEWVRENLTKEQKEDVVLLKGFLKAGNLYGSSLKVRGFSGYLCEILVAHYGSFREVIENVAEWREETLIDPEEYHVDGMAKELQKKFSDDSLVVIDPVDLERNVASVLTSDNYARFIYRCWKFQESKGLNFFEKEETSLEKFQLEREIERRADFIVLEFDTVDEPDDIVYPQMRKTMRRLERRLDKNEFRVYEKGFHVGEKIRVFFELDTVLPDIQYQKGPKVFHGTEHIEQFTSKYENTFVSDERICAKIERDYTHAKYLLKDFLSGEVGDLKDRGIPGNIAEKIVEFRMREPILDDEEWLKFLAEKLKVEQ